MGTRRSTACAALVAALLLAMSAPALAVVSGPVSDFVERTESTLKDTVEGVDDGVETVTGEVEETAGEVEKAVDEVLGEDPDGDPDDGPDDDGTAGDDDGTREARDDRSQLAKTVQAVEQVVTRASPASALPLFRVDQSHQTSLQRFRVADMAAGDVLEMPPTLDDVLAPVVRADTDEVSPATETPVIAAPAHTEAIAATPDGPGYAALAAALLIVLVSTALLAEVRARGPESA